MTETEHMRGLADSVAALIESRALSVEHLQTAEGMLNAGAQRDAVANRLKDNNLDATSAEVVVDYLEARHAAKFATPTQPPIDTATETTVAEAPTATTGSGDTSASLARTKTFTASQRRKLASDGHVQLMVGMAPEQLKAQWIELGMAEGAATTLLEEAQNIKPAKKKDRAKTDRYLVMGLVAASLIGLVALGLMVLRGPSATDQATEIARAACGGGEIYAVGIGPKPVLLVSDKSYVSGSLSLDDEQFADFFRRDGEVRPDKVVCVSAGETAPIVCEGYQDISARPLIPNSDDQSLNLLSYGSTLSFRAVDIDTNQPVGSTSVRAEPDCPDVFRGQLGEQHQTPLQQSVILRGLREAVAD